MPLVFPVTVELLALLAVLVALALSRTETIWLRPLVESLQHPRGSWWKRMALKPLAAVAVATLYIERAVRHALSNFAHGSLHLLTRFFAGLAATFHHTYADYAKGWHEWADAFAWFRHKTMPATIHKQVAPANARAKAAQREAARSISLGKALRIRTGRSIDRLNRKTGLLAGILLGIDVLVHGRHAPRHHADHTRTLPHIRDVDIPHGRAVDRAHGKELADHRSRLKRVEKTLAGVVGGLIVFRILARVAPWLFCRNWKVLGRAVCGMNPNSLANLIGLLVGAWALSDLRRSARLAEDALDVVTHVVWDAAAIGDRPSGRFTID